MRNGCTELAPLSCTTDLKVAVRFASSHSSVLFLINSDIDFMQRPVSVRWLSTMPFEDEHLCPPCTRLAPTGRAQVIRLFVGQTCTVVEVEPFL
jgi:hypothetical protein